MEDPVPQALGQVQLPAEGKGQKEGAQPLEEGRHGDDPSGQLDDPADLRGGDCLLHGAALLERDLLSGGGSDHHREGDHPHPSHLDQEQEDHLPKAAPVGGGVLDDQSGDADGGGGSEQGVGKAGARAVLGGEGQHQHQAPRQDRRREAQDDDLGGGQPALRLPHTDPPSVLTSHLSIIAQNMPASMVRWDRRASAGRIRSRPPAGACPSFPLEKPPQMC